jgi:hypothetical protein
MAARRSATGLPALRAEMRSCREQWQIVEKSRVPLAATGLFREWTVPSLARAITVAGKPAKPCHLNAIGAVGNPGDTS